MMINFKGHLYNGKKKKTKKKMDLLITDLRQILPTILHPQPLTSNNHSLTQASFKLVIGE